MLETSAPSIAPALTALGFCGGMGAGKTTLVTQLSERWSGAQSISFGDFVRHQAALLGLELNRDTLQNLGQRFYEEHDSASFVDLVLWWKRPQGTIHLFDGVRHVQIWHAIARRYENAHLIYLDLDVEHQRERLKSRGDIETLLRLGSFGHIVEDERVLLREQASLVVDSQNSIEDTIAQIERFTQLK